ncbi:MAG: FAD-dependent oxidoreductase [Chloroflexota bacterium]
MANRVVVLGAGPAGAGAAFRLAQDGVQVTLLERGDGPGGVAGSFELAGMRVDYGSHRLHPQVDPRILADLRRLLGEDLRWRPRHGRISVGGRWVGFPLRPLDLLVHLPPALTLMAARDALAAPLRGARPAVESFAGVLERGLGPALCHALYFPYARKVWGLEPQDLSPVQARRRVSARTPLALAGRLLPGKRRSRAFYYPRGGYGRISEALAAEAERLGANTHYGATVTAVEVVDRRAVAVRVMHGGQERRFEADHIFSTLPLSALVRLAEPAAPEPVRRAAAALTTRAMVLVYLVLEAEHFSPYDAHYFPEPEVSITRLSEPKHYGGGPAGVTVLCAELPCALGDAIWSANDDALGRLVADDLARADIPLGAPVRQVAVRRLPHAYPIYRAGFEAHFASVDAWVGGVEGLLTFGRQGLFAHDNAHHALAMAYAAADSLRTDGGLDRERWAQFRTAFDRHVVVD